MTPAICDVSVACTLGVLAGCGRDYYARRLITHSRLPGRIRLARLGPVEQLRRRGLIDAHRRIDAPDGTAMDVWVIRARGVGAPTDSPRGTVLLLHGLWDSKARMFRPAQRLAEKGFDVVLPDLRAHGRSGGRYTTWGALEAGDLKAVMDALAREGLGGRPVYVGGFSMGGGVAVQYAATEPRCAGVLALGPVASARHIMRWMLRLIAPLMCDREAEATIARAGELAGFDADAASAVRAVRRLRCPVVVAHGRLDLTVPTDHGRDVYDAAVGPKRLVLRWTGHNSLLYGRSNWIAEQFDRIARGAIDARVALS